MRPMPAGRPGFCGRATEAERRLRSSSGGPVFYATVDGRRRRYEPSARLAKRSRRGGYLTRSQAEAKLEAILRAGTKRARPPHAGQDVTFADRSDRSGFATSSTTASAGRRPSATTARSCAASAPAFGASTPLWRSRRSGSRAAASSWSPRAAERPHDQQAADPAARDLQAGAARLRAASKPGGRVDRQPSGAPATSRSSRPTRSSSSLPTPPASRTALSSPSPPSPACGWASCARCAGPTSTGCAGLSHVRRSYTPGRRARPSRARSARFRSSTRRRGALSR